jgi:C4-dicarboxylate transporter DctQ subunit
MQNGVAEKIWQAVLYVNASLFFLGTFLTAANVVMRKVFNNPWIGTEEMDSILLVLLVFLPLAYVEWTHKQLTVSVLFDRFPPKVQFWVRKLQHLVILILSAYLTLSTWEVIQRNMDAGNKTAALGIPMYLLYLIIFIGFGLTALTKLVQIFMSEEPGDLHVN